MSKPADSTNHQIDYNLWVGVPLAVIGGALLIGGAALSGSSRTVVVSPLAVAERSPVRFEGLGMRF